MKTCLVVPCYNEETRLETPALLAFLKEQEGVDLLLVDDGSQDGTKTLLEQLQKQNPERIQCLSLAQNSGKAEAVRQGVQFGLKSKKYEMFGFWDADLSTPLSETLRMLDYFERFPHLKMIFGSRLLKLGNRIERLWIRHYLGRIFATCVSLMLQAPVYDTQCGAKLFRRKIAESLFAEPFVSRWFFDVELLWRFTLAKENLLTEVFEMPVKVWIHKAGSKLKLKDFALTFWELFRIWRHYHFREKN